MTSGNSRRIADAKWMVAVVTLVAAAAIAACGSSTSHQATPTATPAVSQPLATATPLPDLGPVTYVDPVYQPDGNRLADGSGLSTGFIQQITTKDINLGGIPTWVTGT
ncbi:MAG: hypothetical protein OXN95_00130, partial [bacterium]|nr:hypothetical protein [bacterium]